MSVSKRMERALFSKRTRRDNHPRPALHYQGHLHRPRPGLLFASQSVSASIIFLGFKVSNVKKNAEIHNIAHL